MWGLSSALTKSKFQGRGLGSLPLHRVYGVRGTQTRCNGRHTDRHREQGDRATNPLFAKRFPQHRRRKPHQKAIKDFSPCMSLSTPVGSHVAPRTLIRPLIAEVRAQIGDDNAPPLIGDQPKLGREEPTDRANWMANYHHSSRHQYLVLA